MTINDHRLVAWWAAWPRTSVLVADSHIRKHPDLRGHQADPARGDGAAAPEV